MFSSQLHTESPTLSPHKKEKKEQKENLKSTRLDANLTRRQRSTKWLWKSRVPFHNFFVTIMTILNFQFFSHEQWTSLSQLLYHHNEYFEFLIICLRKRVALSAAFQIFINKRIYWNYEKSTFNQPHYCIRSCSHPWFWKFSTYFVVLAKLPTIIITMMTWDVKRNELEK